MANISETDIANRALQRVGAQAIAALWTEDSQNAAEMRRCFDMLRTTELRRNVWRFSIREVVSRPIDVNTYAVSFPVWDARIKYVTRRDLVQTPNTQNVDGDGGSWVAGVGGINHDPDVRVFGYWQKYVGTTFADAYDATVSYYTGEIVFDDTEDAPNRRFYVSLLNNNVGNALTDATNWYRLSPHVWHVGSSYSAGDRVYYNSISYVAIQSSVGLQPDISPVYWGVYTDFASRVWTFTYPIGTGPLSQTQTRNVYPLASGFLRLAPQAPKQGSYQILGSPSNLAYNDWQFESDYFTSTSVGPISVRFAADIVAPSAMDPMFIDGFSCRLAIETCERLTQSVSKVQELTALYNKFMAEARMVNGIETGPTEPPLDSYITVRF